MSPSGTIMSYIFPMQEKPALRPSVAVGEALRGVARNASPTATLGRKAGFSCIGKI